MKNLKEVLPTFNTSLYKAIDKAWGGENDDMQVLENLAAGSELLLKAIEEVGDLAFGQIVGDKQPLKNIETEALVELLKLYLLNYRWPEQAKSLMILWRDILLEQQKAHIYKKDEKILENDLEVFRVQSKSTLLNAIDDLKAFLPRNIEESRRSRQGSKKRIEKWRLQTNPWPFYKKQMAAIPEQCQDLLQQHELSLNAWASFHQIRETVLNMVYHSKAELDSIKKIIGETTQLIEQEIAKKDPRCLNRVAVKLEDREASITLPNHLNTFTSILEEQSNTLPEQWKVVVDSKEGLLQTKTIGLKRRVRQWIESEMLPLLYEVWEITEAASNGMKMVLVNIRNRAVLLSTDNYAEGSNIAREMDFEQSDVATPLHIFLKNIQEQEQVMLRLERLLEQRLEKDFKISNIYENTQNFLPIPLQSTINQFKLSQNKLVDGIRSWFNLQKGAITRFQKSVRREETLGISEKIVRYLQNLALDPANNHYSSIFLTRGYVGESFVVGRTEELQHVSHLVSDWEKRFRGSVMLTGKRFSGKSLFGELVANRFFSNKTIHLAPESLLKVQSRKMHTSFDIKPALEFIRKHTLNERPLVWIDDLELWWSPDVPLYQNVRTLAKFIDHYSSNIFL